jgi:hypothetical protein
LFTHNWGLINTDEDKKMPVILLVEASEPNLGMTMQWINVSHAAYFNRKRGRHDHL